MKKLTSLLLTLVMCITLLSPAQAKEVQAAETTKVNTWAISDLLYGDTYGIYPLSWYEKGVTGAISRGKFLDLYFGLRRKLVATNCVVEKRFEAPVIGSTITVENVIKAFYTLLNNYDYTVDMGLSLGLDPVTYMKQIGVYTGKNGEQGLKEACSMEQAMVMATRLVTTVYEALDASSKGFLWEVKSGENTVYLLGSIHLASTQIYPFSTKILQAYYSSSALIGEANLYDQADVAALRNLMYYTDGTTLKEHVAEDTYNKAIEAAALMNIPEETAKYIKPWALYLMLQGVMATDTTGTDQTSASLGIDLYLETNAMIFQKPIYAIEGAEAQGKIMESLSAELQEYLLSEYSTLFSDMMNGTSEVSKTDVDESIDLWYEAWKSGDVEAFKKLTASEENDAFTGNLTDKEKAYYDEYKLKFMTQRDDNMASYINNLLKSKDSNTYFVVLGAAHFISDYSVIDRLKKQGYEVTQIK